MNSLTPLEKLRIKRALENRRLIFFSIITISFIIFLLTHIFWLLVPIILFSILFPRAHEIERGAKGEILIFSTSLATFYVFICCFFIGLVFARSILGEKDFSYLPYLPSSAGHNLKFFGSLFLIAIVFRFLSNKEKTFKEEEQEVKSKPLSPPQDHFTHGA